MNKHPLLRILCRRGGLFLHEKQCPVYLGNKAVGKVRIVRQGLYYVFFCRCQLTGDIICRLHVSCGTCQVDLGILVPVDSGFGLETKIPAKRLCEGEMAFHLTPGHCTAGVKYVSIYPDEPFHYIRALKTAFLSRSSGQSYAVIQEPQGKNPLG